MVVWLSLHTQIVPGSEARFRTYDAHDALPLVGHVEVLEAEVAYVLLRLEDLGLRVHLQYGGFHGAQLGLVLGGNVVVHCDQVQAGRQTTWFASTRPLTAWGDVTSWTRAVDVQEGGGPVRLADLKPLNSDVKE